MLICISTSDWPFELFANNLPDTLHLPHAALLQTILLKDFFFLYFTIRPPVGRLNLLSVLYPSWPLLIIDEGFPVLHNLGFADVLYRCWVRPSVQMKLCTNLLCRRRRPKYPHVPQSSICSTQNCLVQRSWDHCLTLAVDHRLIDTPVYFETQ